MITPKQNPAFTMSREMEQALSRLGNNEDFQVWVKCLEERLDGLALGAAMPINTERRNEMCGRVQELYDVICATKTTRKNLQASMDARQKPMVAFGG